MLPEDASFKAVVAAAQRAVDELSRDERYRPLLMAIIAMGTVPELDAASPDAQTKLAQQWARAMGRLQTEH